MSIDEGKIVLLAQVVSTLFMAGLIWFVQIVHYPLLARVGSGGFTEYEAAHVRWTTWVVGPPMLTEALTAVLMVWRPPAGVSPLLCGIGLCLLLVIWTSTALLQVPRHNTLANGFDPDAHRNLVQSNWIRTIAWTIRGALVVVMINQIIAGGPIRA
jgi:hypothetical protein